MKPLICYITTHDKKSAENIGAELLKKKLASCIMTIPAIHSQYAWKGKIVHDKESLLMIKTFDTKFDALRKLVIQLHPYEVPCIIATPITFAHPEYIKWSVEAAR